MLTWHLSKGFLPCFRLEDESRSSHCVCGSQVHLWGRAVALGNLSPASRSGARLYSNNLVLAREQQSKN